jgi:hypothetical protein
MTHNQRIIQDCIDTMQRQIEVTRCVIQRLQEIEGAPENAPDKPPENKSLMDAIENIYQIVDTELGDWKSVEIDYCPMRLHGYKEIQGIINGLEEP